jgi:CRISPR-associated protein Csm3
MKLINIKKITGEINCITNLHIGGSKDEMEIGGMDNPIIKHPITNEPYIPGSSLKGVMRCSMERMQGKAGNRACGCGACDVCRIFGSLNNNDIGPTRLIVRDAMMTDECRQEYKRFMDEQSQPYLGIKYENSIQRNTGKAEHPRPNEFVPSGTRFSMELVLQVYSMNDKSDPVSDFDFICKALKLVSERYIGGYGSRGYGKIEFQNLKCDGVNFGLDDVKLF